MEITSNPFRRQQQKQQQKLQQQLPVDHGHRSLGNDTAGPSVARGDGSGGSSGGSSSGGGGGGGVGGDSAVGAVGLTADHVPASAAESPSASTTTSKSPVRMRPKPPPPVVAPRKRGSRIDPPASTLANQNTEQQHIIDPFITADVYTPGVSEKAVLLPQEGINGGNSALPNPFLQRAKSTTKARRSLDVSALYGSLAASREYGASDHPNRQSLDVNAFKQLMLKGQALQLPIAAADSNNSSIALPTGSRLSVSEPIADRVKPDDDIFLRVEDGEFERPTVAESIPTVATQHSLSRSSSNRVKPPLPKPRTRTGGKSSLLLTSPAQITPPALFPISNQPPSFIESDRLLPSPPPPPPPPLAVSPGGVMGAEKKVAPPPPPVSRRHSMRHRPAKPAAVGGSESSKPAKLSTSSSPPPPPPPMRRAKSVRHTPGVSASEAGTSNLSHPPPPPPPRKPRSINESSERPNTLVTIETKRSDDILVNLEKLQREVDELRGKYGTHRQTAAVTLPQAAE